MSFQSKNTHNIVCSRGKELDQECLTPSDGQKTNNLVMFESFQNHQDGFLGCVQMESKKSTSTIASIDKYRVDTQRQEQLECLDFTFNTLQHDNTLPSQKTTKFSHQSLESVILYSILLNHLHLQKRTQILPEIEKQSKSMVEAIKEAFIEVEEEINQNQPQMLFSTIELMQILHPNSGTVSKRQVLLMKLLKRLNADSVQLMFGKMIQMLKIGQKLKEVKEMVQQDSLNIRSNDIKEFAELVGLRIKLYNGNQKKSMGLRSSLMTIIVKKSSSSSVYYLKEIICAEDTN